MITDIIDRPIAIDDYVVYSNDIYVVTKLANTTVLSNGGGHAYIQLAKPSAEPGPIKKYSKDMCLLNKDDVLLWLLKRKNK